MTYHSLRDVGTADCLSAGRPAPERLLIDLKAGSATATVWTNDLTHDYVHENSAYST